jgi:hypothetical protein
LVTADFLYSPADVAPSPATVSHGHIKTGTVNFASDDAALVHAWVEDFNVTYLEGATNDENYMLYSIAGPKPSITYPSPFAPGASPTQALDLPVTLWLRTMDPLPDQVELDRETGIIDFKEGETKIEEESTFHVETIRYTVSSVINIPITLEPSIQEDEEEPSSTLDDSDDVVVLEEGLSTTIIIVIAVGATLLLGLIVYIYYYNSSAVAPALTLVEQAPVNYPDANGAIDQILNVEKEASVLVE